MLLNCESIGAMAAGLGLSMGIMGYHLPELAAVRWHRIAPAFSGGETYISDKILYDAYHFREGSHWDPYLINKTIGQGAPAVISRNTKLPKVGCKALNIHLHTMFQDVHLRNFPIDRLLKFVFFQPQHPFLSVLHTLFYYAHPK